MILKAHQEEAEVTVVLFNDKPLSHYVAACDDEGWIEVIDPAAMAPLDTEDEGELTAEDAEGAWVPLKTKKIFGKVELRKITALG